MGNYGAGLRDGPLESQGHSGFTWTMLGSIEARTDGIGLMTGVTCPHYRGFPDAAPDLLGRLRSPS